MRSRDTIVLHRDVEANESITSTRGSVIIHGNVKDSARLTGRDGVKIKGNVSNHTYLEASRGLVEVEALLGNHNILLGRDGVEVADIGNHNKLDSIMGKIKTKNIGNHNTIEGRDGVDAKNIGKYNHLTASMNVVQASHVGSRSELDGRDGVNVISTEDDTVKLESSRGDVVINGQAQPSKKIRDDICEFSVDGKEYIIRGSEFSFDDMDDILIDGTILTPDDPRIISVKPYGSAAPAAAELPSSMSDLMIKDQAKPLKKTPGTYVEKIVSGGTICKLSVDGIRYTIRGSAASVDGVNILIDGTVLTQNDSRIISAKPIESAAAAANVSVNSSSLFKSIQEERTEANNQAPSYEEVMKHS